MRFSSTLAMRAASMRDAEQARRARQLPLPAGIAEEIAEICVDALDSRAIVSRVAEQVQAREVRSGVLVRAKNTTLLSISDTITATMRQALTTCGYVLAPEDVGDEAVLVTGIDPQHPHGPLTVERIDSLMDELLAVRRARLSS